MIRSFLPFAIVLLLMVAGGCRHRPAPAPPQNVIILLPNEDGSSSGSLVVFNHAGSQQLTNAYSKVKVTHADTPPSTPVQVDPAEIQRLFGETLALLPQAEVRFNLYFEFGGTVLTRDSQAELPRILEAYRRRKSTDVTIIGHTDTVGDSQTNYQLGLQRAEQISHEMLAQGVRAADVFIESHGKNDLLVPTLDNVEEPRNRRVEVIVR